MQKSSISIRTFTASDAGFVVNSHLIMGEKYILGRRSLREAELEGGGMIRPLAKP
jgi:hypothetical protein